VLLVVTLVLVGAVVTGVGIPFGPELLTVLPLLIVAYATYRLVAWGWRRIRGTPAETH
jgi:hypothetical protein